MNKKELFVLEMNLVQLSVHRILIINSYINNETDNIQFKTKISSNFKIIVKSEGKMGIIRGGDAEYDEFAPSYEEKAKKLEETLKLMLDQNS